ncbi:hypothetical protein B0H10DRAFT_1967639 [Mycena sp. CBHHK59/15]|nr:hypothetical protein B0H10DRAFT_1967639 [Mycena sp. CBHHK59/15]
MASAYLTYTHLINVQNKYMVRRPVYCKPLFTLQHLLTLWCSRGTTHFTVTCAKARPSSGHYGDPQFMLNIPKPVNTPSPHPASVDREFLRPTWVSPTTPYLILLPHFNPFYGLLFKHLNYTKETIPVQISTRKGWHLAPGLIQEWTVLEQNLRNILQAMYNFHPGAVSDVMVPFAYPLQFRTAVLASVLVGFPREYDQTIHTVNTEGMATYDIFWDGYNEYLGQIRDF